jgi:hypothetical protein
MSTARIPRPNTQTVRSNNPNNSYKQQSNAFHPRVIDTGAFHGGDEDIPPYQEEQHKISEFIRNHKFTITVIIIIIIVLLVVIFVWNKYSNPSTVESKPPDKEVIKEDPNAKKEQLQNTPDVDKEEKVTKDNQKDDKIELSDSEDEEHVKKTETKLKPPKRSDIINKAKKVDDDSKSEDFYNDTKVD